MILTRRIGFISINVQKVTFLMVYFTFGFDFVVMIEGVAQQLANVKMAVYV